MITSGLRIGTSALATRGFAEEDFAEVADVIAEALRPSFPPPARTRLRERVELLAKRHPLYQDL